MQARREGQRFAALSGDFDGQGLSLGVCQWNLGQGTLQALLRAMDADHSDVVQAIFDAVVRFRDSLAAGGAR